MEKAFRDVAVGEKFVFSQTEYVKMDTVQISCCSSVNCYVSGDPSNINFISGDSTVITNG